MDKPRDKMDNWKCFRAGCTPLSWDLVGEGYWLLRTFSLHGMNPISIGFYGFMASQLYCIEKFLCFYWSFYPYFYPDFYQDF